MNTLPLFLTPLALLAVTLTSCTAQTPNAQITDSSTLDSLEVQKSEAEWREELPHMACFVLREKGTERAFTGEFWDHHEKVVYRCAGCGQALFDSEHKFESGTGWPSFFQPAEGTAILEEEDEEKNNEDESAFANMDYDGAGDDEEGQIDD